MADGAMLTVDVDVEVEVDVGCAHSYRRPLPVCSRFLVVGKVVVMLADGILGGGGGKNMR